MSSPLILAEFISESPFESVNCNLFINTSIPLEIALNLRRTTIPGNKDDTVVENSVDNETGSLLVLSCISEVLRTETPEECKDSACLHFLLLFQHETHSDFLGEHNLFIRGQSVDFSDIS